MLLPPTLLLLLLLLLLLPALSVFLPALDGRNLSLILSKSIHLPVGSRVEPASLSELELESDVLEDDDCHLEDNDGDALALDVAEHSRAATSSRSRSLRLRRPLRAAAPLTAWLLEAGSIVMRQVVRDPRQHQSQ